MAFNGSGTFNRLYNWVTDDGNGINIEASRMDGEDDGFATGLSNCITKDGQTTITANIPFNSKKITGLANGSARTDSISLGQVQDNSFGTLGTLGGSADTYTASPSPSITAYATGMEFNLKVNADNTGASTLNVSAVGAKDIKKYDGAGSVVDLEAGDLQQDQYYKVVYDGTQFVVLDKNPATTTVQGISYLKDFVTINFNSSDADHDIDITAGVFQFDDGSGQALLGALTKQIDNTWSAGTNQGGLDTGSVTTNTYYYLFAIWNPTTATADVLFSASATSPTLPSGYTKKQRIGQVLTDASSNIDSTMIGIANPFGQTVYRRFPEVADSTGTFPNDDSKPQITEGTQYMSLQIAPLRSTSKLEIDSILNGATDNSPNWSIITALFQDSTADALAAVATQGTTADGQEQCVLSHHMVSGTTSATTFRIRAGLNVAGTLTFNGQSGVRRFGGVFASFIKITEKIG